MMSEQRRAVPVWLSYLDLACATVAGGLWYASSRWEPLILALAPWVIRLLLTRRPTRRTPFDVPLALFLLTAAVGIWAAYDREAAWARFWVILGGVFIFYALANAESAGSLRVWYLTLFGAGAAAVFVLTYDWEASAGKIGLLTRFGQALQASLPDLPPLDANVNIVAAILAAMLPFAGLAVVQARQRLLDAPRPRPAGSGPILRPGLLAGLVLALSIAALLLVAFGLLMTVTRAAWISVAGALSLAAVWLVAGRLSRDRPTVRNWIFAGWLVLMLAAILLVVVVRPGVIPALLAALPGPSPVGARTELWRNGLTLVRDYPFTGAGLEGFMMVYSSYVMLLHVGFIPHTHNLYLDLALEQGLPALLIFLCMCGLFFARFWRQALRPDAHAPRAEMGAAALSLLIILLHGLVDDPFYRGRAVLWFFVPLAFVGTLPQVQLAVQQRKHRWTLPALTLGAIALVAAALLWRAPLLSRVASNLGAVYQTRVELADYTWPEWPIQDEVRRNKDLGPAVAQYERALALDPGNATANRRLGQIELSLGQYEAALDHLKAAYAVEPASNTTRQLLGEAYLANGQREEGRVLWSGVRNDRQQLEIRAWWYEHIGEKERAEWMRWAAGSP